MVEWVEKINLAAMEIPTMAEDSMKAHCNGCGPHRTHNILFKVERHWGDDEGDLMERTATCSGMRWM
jgi:hypothetical protein